MKFFSSATKLAFCGAHISTRRSSTARPQNLIPQPALFSSPTQLFASASFAGEKTRILSSVRDLMNDIEKELEEISLETGVTPNSERVQAAARSVAEAPKKPSKPIDDEILVAQASRDTEEESPEVVEESKPEIKENVVAKNDAPEEAKPDVTDKVVAKGDKVEEVKPEETTETLVAKSDATEEDKTHVPAEEAQPEPTEKVIAKSDAAEETKPGAPEEKMMAKSDAAEETKAETTEKVVAKADSAKDTKPEAPEEKAVAKSDAVEDAMPQEFSEKVVAKADSAAETKPEVPEEKVIAKSDAVEAAKPEDTTEKVVAKADSAEVKEEITDTVVAKSDAAVDAKPEVTETVVAQADAKPEAANADDEAPHPHEPHDHVEKIVSETPKQEAEVERIVASLPIDAKADVVAAKADVVVANAAPMKIELAQNVESAVPAIKESSIQVADAITSNFLSEKTEAAAQVADHAAAVMQHLFDQASSFM